LLSASIKNKYSQKCICATTDFTKMLFSIYDDIKMFGALPMLKVHSLLLIYETSIFIMSEYSIQSKLQLR